MLIFFILIQSHISYRLNSKKVVYAINCGSTQDYLSKDGFRYLADHNFVGQTIVADWTQDIEVNSARIRFTDDRDVFMTERWADKGNFGYVIPIQEEGEYVLITQHAEHSFNGDNQRVWNLMIGNQIVLEKIDVHQHVGIHSAINFYTPFIFKNDEIIFNNQVIKNGYNKKQKGINIVFKYLGIDNPYINAIILFKGKLEETDYPKLKEIYDKYTFMYDAERRDNLYQQQYLQQRSIARMKHKKRNDQLIIEDDYDQIYIEEELQKGFKKHFLILILVICITLLGYFMIDVFKEVKNLEEKNEQQLNQFNSKKQILFTHFLLKTPFILTILLERFHSMIDFLFFLQETFKIQNSILQFNN